MRRLVAVVAVLVTSMLAMSVPAQADADGGPLAVTVVVDGLPIADRTVPIDPDQPVSLLITATNDGTRVQQVRTVRFDGGVLGLRFFAYDTTVPFDVPAHQSASRTLVLDLADLHNQAIGLLPSSVELLDAGGGSLGGVDTVTDVRGSILSLYGALGIVLLVFAAAAWVSAGRALARRRDRRGRGWVVGRFLPAGIGTGLLAVVWLSVFRVVPPHPLPAFGILAGGVLVGLVAAAYASRPEPEYEPLTTIIDPTVGVKAGVLDPEGIDDLPAAHDDAEAQAPDEPEYTGDAGDGTPDEDVKSEESRETSSRS